MEEIQIKHSDDKNVSKTNEMSFWCLCKLRVSVVSMELQFYQLGKNYLKSTENRTFFWFAHLKFARMKAAHHYPQITYHYLPVHQEDDAGH
jgi:hypothetical protein